MVGGGDIRGATLPTNPDIMLDQIGVVLRNPILSNLIGRSGMPKPTVTPTPPLVPPIQRGIHFGLPPEHLPVDVPIEINPVLTGQKNEFSQLPPRDGNPQKVQNDKFVPVRQPLAGPEVEFPGRITKLGQPTRIAKPVVVDLIADSAPQRCDPINRLFPGFHQDPFTVRTEKRQGELNTHFSTSIRIS